MSKKKIEYDKTKPIDSSFHIKCKGIDVRIRNTDLEILKRLSMGGVLQEIVKPIDEMDDINKSIYYQLNQFCSDVYWFNRDKNPYEDEEK